MFEGLPSISNQFDVDKQGHTLCEQRMPEHAGSRLPVRPIKLT